MELIYDYYTVVEATPEWEEALKTLLREEMKMMQQATPEYADRWAWGECEVSDLAHSGNLSFSFGSLEDKPEDMAEDVRIIIKPFNNENIPNV